MFNISFIFYRNQGKNQGFCCLFFYNYCFTYNYICELLWLQALCLSQELLLTFMRKILQIIILRAINYYYLKNLCIKFYTIIQKMVIGKYYGVAQLLVSKEQIKIYLVDIIFFVYFFFKSCNLLFISNLRTKFVYFYVFNTYIIQFSRKVGNAFDYYVFNKHFKPKRKKEKLFGTVLKNDKWYWNIWL